MISLLKFEEIEGRNISLNFIESFLGLRQDRDFRLFYRLQTFYIEE